MDILFHDLRYALRSLRRQPIFAGTTTLTLGLGIGVIAALFAIVDAVLLNPIAPEQDRVVRIWKYDEQRGLDRHPLSYPEFLAWRDGSRSFEALAAIQYADASSIPVTIDNEPTSVLATPVSAGFFEVLRAGRTIHGRWLDPRDDLKTAEPVAVVSEPFWRRVTGGDPGFVGRRLMVAGGARSLVVIGIAPAAVDYPLGTDLWVPAASFFHILSTTRFDVESRAFIQFNVIGRLARGASPGQAQAELTLLDRQWTAQFPDDARPMRVVVEPLLDTVVGNSRQVLLFLFLAAGLVFVIAGVNVAALLLMRAASRRSEIAVRVALGASHARLARQTLIEGLLVGALGAAAGLVIATLFLGAVQALAPENIPRVDRAGIDVRVLAFSASAAFLWVLIFGTAPSWSRRRLEATAALGRAELADRGVRGTAALRLFTMAEIASAVVVAIAAGLLLRSFVQLQAIDRGFDARNMAVVSLLLPQARYPDARARLTFYEELEQRLASVPGVLSASPVHMGPGTGNTGLSAGMRFEGQTPEEAEKNPWGSFEPVLPSYFQTLGIPITRGRPFTDADGRDGAPVAIVSEAVAVRYWPGQDPVGKRLQFTADEEADEALNRWATVVGVAADTRYRELTRNWLTVYFPADQFFFFAPGSLVVRTASAPESFVAAIRQTIHTQEPHAALRTISTMEALAARELSRPRAALAVAGLFAIMAILLAAVGVYGVMSYDVSRRRRELAVRSALGATPDRIFRDVVLRSLTLGGIGLAAGLVTAWIAARFLRVLLFDVSPADPATFVAGALGLLVIVLLASILPARRAAGADPVAVLRAE